MFERLKNWNFEDLLEQLRTVGSVSDIAARIPGLAQVLRDQELDWVLQSAEAILLAMTTEERRDPERLAGAAGAARRAEVAAAAKVAQADVDRLVTRFLEARRRLRAMIESEALPAETWQEIEDQLPSRAEEPTPDEQTDDVLRKVARLGLGSLSPAERAVLEDASRRYRARR